MWMSRGCVVWLLLLAFALLMNGCASLPPPPGRDRNLGYTPRGDSGPPWEEGTGEEPEQPQRLHRRRGLLHALPGL
jgi:hypothetical protein